MKRSSIVFACCATVAVLAIVSIPLREVRAVRIAPIGGGGPGAIMLTANKKPEPAIIAQGVLEAVDFETVGDLTNMVYFWHVTFTGGQNIVVTRRDPGLILDIGTEYKVVVDPETKERDILPLE